MTVHRAQGQTIPSCHIRLGEKGFRQPGQTYVAFSRVPGATAISLSRPLTLGDIRSDESTVKFLRHVENQAERPVQFDRLPRSA